MKAVVHDEYRRHAETHWWFRARRDLLNRLLDAWLPAAAPRRILDIGPGSGVNLPVLAPRGDVVVLDRDRGSLQSCAAAGVGLVAGDGQQPPFAAGSFDLVCALDVLEHLDDDVAALTAWRALLAAEGRLLVTVPALPMLWGRQDVLSQHRRRYRRRALKDALHAAGYRIERLTYFNTLLLPPILLVRLAMRPLLHRTTTTAAGGSDLAMPSFGLAGLLQRTFTSEARWLRQHDLPIGVSLLALVHR